MTSREAFKAMGQAAQDWALHNTRDREAAWKDARDAFFASCDREGVSYSEAQGRYLAER